MSCKRIIDISAHKRKSPEKYFGAFVFPAGIEEFGRIDNPEFLFKCDCISDSLLWSTERCFWELLYCKNQFLHLNNKIFVENLVNLLDKDMRIHYICILI